MTIHLYAVCWNEEKMLPHFLKHYAAICDQIFVYDNYSSDNSAEICKSHPKVSLRQYDSGGQIRDDIYLLIKNEVWKRSRGVADWVIVCDVDEFLYTPDLMSTLKQLTENGTTLVRSVGYNMVSPHYPSPQDQLLELIREGVRSVDFDKVILFRPDAIDAINYAAGAHTCYPVGRLQYADVEVKLLHYKYLSLENHIERYQLMSNRLSKFNKKHNLGFHYSYSKRKITKEFNTYWNNRVQVI